MRAGAALLSVFAALALIACGGSSNSASTGSGQGTPGAGGSSTAAHGNTSTTTTVVTSTVASTAAPGPPPCVASDLAASFLGQQGATGHGLLGFALRNVSGHSCHTFGYPGVLFLDKAGHALPTASTRTTRDFFGPAPRVRLLVAPGQTVSFRIGVLHGVVPTEPCTTAYQLQVIAPDDTRTLVATIPGGAYECTTATVSPLRPGRSAYP